MNVTKLRILQALLDEADQMELPVETVSVKTEVLEEAVGYIEERMQQDENAKLDNKANTANTGEVLDKVTQIDTHVQDLTNAIKSIVSAGGATTSDAEATDMRAIISAQSVIIRAILTLPVDQATKEKITSTLTTMKEFTLIEEAQSRLKAAAKNRRILGVK